MIIGQLLRKWREYKDFNLREMARETNVSYATLCRIERGQDCDSKTMLTLVNWLFGSTKEKKPE